MSSRNYKFSLITSIVMLVSAYLFTTGYLLIRLTDLDVRTADWSYALIYDLLTSHAGLSFVLAVPAIYSLLVLLSLLIHRKRIQIASLTDGDFLRLSSKSLTRKEIEASSVIATMPAVIETEPESEVLVRRPSESAAANNALVERLKKDLTIAEQQLLSAKKAKSQFLANMSHELRTPMNGILGMTELLAGSGLSNRQTRFADSVRRSAESLLGVINDLLDYSSMESGNMYLEKASFNIRDLVEDVCDLQAREAQIKGLELICHIDRSMNDQVIGDANRIRQLLSNLVSNAVKFTKTGEIVVRVKQSDFSSPNSTYQFDVVDTGIGITPEGQARIFDSFTQADISRAREFGGSGLGLFITQKLVEMMDGKISLRSRMNQGSHFSTTIKLRNTVSEVESLNLTDTLRGVRVLVVDDNETNRTILFHQLRSWGVDPETVESGAQALLALKNAQASGSPFEAAILDLHMPEMDGIELTRKIHSDADICDTKRMMLTSAALDMTEDELEQIGISQYISKPARQSQLYTALSNLIPQSAVRAANQSCSTQYSSFRPLNFKVLLAEDNLINQEVALNMLENFGCSVELANSGQAALDMCIGTPFDLIMMDCVMPIVNGIEATEILRATGGINANTPVLALTANVSAEDEKRCMASGMNDYICKPVKQNELYRRLDKWSAQIRESWISQKLPAKATENQEELGDESDVESTIALQEMPPASAEVANNYVEPDTQDPARILASNTTAIASKMVNSVAIENIRKLQRPGKPDLVQKVVAVYLDKSPLLVEAILLGCSECDLTRVKEAAHSLKSSSAYVGAEELAERFRKIEQSAAAGSLEEVRTLLEGLPELYARMVSELEWYQGQAA